MGFGVKFMWLRIWAIGKLLRRTNLFLFYGWSDFLSGGWCV